MPKPVHNIHMYIFIFVDIWWCRKWFKRINHFHIQKCSTTNQLDFVVSIHNSAETDSQHKQGLHQTGSILTRLYCLFSQCLVWHCCVMSHHDWPLTGCDMFRWWWHSCSFRDWDQLAVCQCCRKSSPKPACGHHWSWTIATAAKNKPQCWCWRLCAVLWDNAMHWRLSD